LSPLSSAFGGTLPRSALLPCEPAPLADSRDAQILCNNLPLRVRESSGEVVIKEDAVPIPLRRLWKKLLCQIICDGKTVVLSDERTGEAWAVVTCRRCGRVLEVEGFPFLAAGDHRRVA